MNVHRKFTKSRSLGLACSVLAISVCGTAVAGRLDEPHYTMSIIVDAVYGNKVLSKDYDVVISRLESSERDGIRSFYASTNLCVAYLKTGDYEGAKSSCDRAVSTIRNEIDTDRDMKRDSYKARMYRTFLAVALSNRGVTHAVTGSPELARDDFTSAMKVDTDMREPEVNLARLSNVDSPSA